MSVELFLSQASDLRPHFTIPAVARSAGHPDALARGLAEATAAALEDFEARQGNSSAVFSLQATVLLPGITAPRFGGGKVVSPMRVLLAGTSALLPNRRLEDLTEVAHVTCAAWCQENLRFVDPRRHLAVELFVRDPGNLRTPTLGVARAPLAASQYLAGETLDIVASREFRERFPEAGDDAEAKALASDSHLTIHLSLAFMDQAVHSARAYFARKEEIGLYILERIRALPTAFDRIDVLVNEGDVEEREEDGCYLTVLGTSADGRRPGRADAAPEGEATSHHAEQFAQMILSRIRGVRAAVVRLEEDDAGVIHRAFVRLELLEGTTLDAVRPAVLEMLPLRAKPSRSLDPNTWT
jgi:S-adenosylmethionine synthetase